MNSKFVYPAAIFVLIAAFLLRLQLQKPTESLPKNQKITFAATLKREPKISDKYQILTVADSKIYAQLFPVYSVGDRLSISGQIDDTGRMLYPQIGKAGEQRGVLGHLSVFRRRISQNIARLLPEREAALVQGTVLGVDSIEKNFKDQLIATGTIHVVVVSGQNLTIVAGVFMAFSRYIGRRKALILACVAVILYAALAGFSVPVGRAVVMVLASTIAVYFGREVWPVWSLVMAAFLILFIWPQALFEVSFQLTFAASLGIMTAGKWMEGNIAGPVSSFLPVGAHSDHNSDRMGKDNPELRAAGNPSIAATRKPFYLSWLRHVFDSNPRHPFLKMIFKVMAVPFSAYLFTLPIIFFNFGRISLVAPIVNVLVAEAVFPIMVLGFLTAGASLIFMPLAQVLAYLAYVPAFYFAKIVEIFAGL